MEEEIKDSHNDWCRCDVCTRNWWYVIDGVEPKDFEIPKGMTLHRFRGSDRSYPQDSQKHFFGKNET